MTNNVIEIVNFKLKDNVDKIEFNRTNEAFQEYIDQQQGVLYRSLAKQGDTDVYVDVVYFESMADAKKAQQAFFENELCQQFAEQIEKESVILEHYNVIAQTPCNG